MNVLVAVALAALLLAGFARPRWWLSLAPVAVAIGLAGYRLATRSGSGQTAADAVAFLGIVLLTVALEGSLLAGVLARAGWERVRARPAAVSVALSAARRIVFTGLAFVCAVIVVARATGGLGLALAALAVGVVAARVWRARPRAAGGGPRFALPAREPRATTTVSPRRPADARRVARRSPGARSGRPAAPHRGRRAVG